VEETRFDGLARTLATRIGRRRALHGLGGGAVAGVFLRLGVEEAAAACVKLGQQGCKGRQHKKCCPGGICKGGTKTKPGQCVCKGGRARCGTACVDTATNPRHCGDCGTTCGEGQACEQGTCVCPGSRTECGTACVDTDSDPRHCGGCGQSCRGTTATCEQGTCANLFGCTTDHNYCDDEIAKCPSGTNARCRCVTDVGGAPHCAYTDFSLYCGPCKANADCPEGWVCHDARACNCPVDEDEGLFGNACVPTRVALGFC
jgi:hypothetical protein